MFFHLIVLYCPTFYKIFRHFRSWFSTFPFLSRCLLCCPCSSSIPLNPLLSVPCYLLLPSFDAHASCSLPETFTVATTLETSTRPWSKRGKSEERVTYPEQLSLVDFQHVDRGRSTGLAYNTNDSRDCRLRSEFFYERFAFSYFRANIFRNCNFGWDTQFLFFLRH